MGSAGLILGITGIAGCLGCGLLIPVVCRRYRKKRRELLHKIENEEL